MKIYVLDSIASEYFGFVKNNNQKILVSSICADYVKDEFEKREFGCLVNDNIRMMLNLKELCSYKAYAIFNKAVYNSPSKLLIFKKIWKDSLIKQYVELLETKDEILTKYDDFYLFSGVSRLKNIDEIDLFSILDMLGFYNLLFLSKYDLSDIYKEFITILNTAFGGSKKTPEINFGALVKEYCKNGNVLIRFGSDFTNMEVSVIYHLEDFPKKLIF